MDTEPTEAQKKLQEFIDSIPRGESLKPPYAFYTPEADMLRVFVSGADKHGHEYVKYEGPWKKGGGQGHAVETVHLRNSDGDRIVGFQIWGITELLESLKEAKAAENKAK